MLLTTLLTLAIAAPAPQAGAGHAVGSRQSRQQVQTVAAPNWQPTPVPQRGIYGEELPGGESEQFATVVGGEITQIGAPIASVLAMPTSGVYQLQFSNPGTGWAESCLVGVPNAPTPSAPLLVMFHSYGVSEYDCYVNTPLFRLALARGWYVVAPLGAHQVNFGVPYSQANVEYVLDWMLATFPIDQQRIYGAGFSMGANAMASYAARHLDPNHARFAAMVNHTGGVSVANTYWSNTPNTGIFDHPLMFNGSPAQYPFEYSQVSLIDLDLANGTVSSTTDMARNVAHIGLRNFGVSQEPNQTAYLHNQVLALHSWMQTFVSKESYLEVFGTTHSWSTLDANATLDFLRQYTLSTPRAGTHKVLADREARWHHFFVYQDAPGAFTPFRWTMIDSLNRVGIDRTENLQRIVIDTASLGLSTIKPVEVVLGAQDGLPEQVTLDGFPNPPLSVTRNGTPSSSWSWDAVTQSVTILESNAGGYPLWRVTP
jgi:pimeloyl-ACP methyl ester carboxylesterase